MITGYNILKAFNKTTIACYKLFKQYGNYIRIYLIHCDLNSQAFDFNTSIISENSTIINLGTILQEHELEIILLQSNKLLLRETGVKIEILLSRFFCLNSLTPQLITLKLFICIFFFNFLNSVLVK